jgi:hypothetical protein
LVLHASFEWAWMHAWKSSRHALHSLCEPAGAAAAMEIKPRSTGTVAKILIFMRLNFQGRVLISI